MQDAHRECSVGSGTQRQEYFGLRTEPGHLRVDRNDLRPAFHAVDDPVAVKTVGIRYDGVVSPEDDALGNLPARIVVALGELLRVIAHPKRARRAHGRGDAWYEACASGKGEHDVGASERPGEVADPRGDIAARALEEQHRLGAELFLVRQKLLGDQIVGFVPGDALPSVFTAILGLALHGVDHAVFVVGGLHQIEAPYAQAPLVEGVVRIALDLDELAVLVGVHEKTAAEMAAGPRPSAPARYRVLALLVAPRLIVLDVFVPVRAADFLPCMSLMGDVFEISQLSLLSRPALRKRARRCGVVLVRGAIPSRMNHRDGIAPRLLLLSVERKRGGSRFVK